MKAKRKGCLIGCLIPVVAVVVLVVVMSIPTPPVTLAERLLDTELPAGTAVATASDTGPGLPVPGGASDGYTWLVLQIPSGGMSEFLSATSARHWHSLPLPPDLQAGFGKVQPSFVKREEDRIPTDATEGRYFWRDLQVEWNERDKSRSSYKTDKPFHERPSLDFIFGLFDATTGKLYVLRVNT